VACDRGDWGTFREGSPHPAADGEYRWFLIRAVPLRDELGRIVKWYGTITDIEDARRRNR